MEGSLRETCTKQGVFDPGQGRVCVWGGILYARGTPCSKLQMQFEPRQLCNCGRFLLFPGRKMAFLFSSLKSPFVILKVPLCLCLCRQLAAALLKIAGGGEPLRAAH